jgi:hypothetical protein
VLEHRDAAAWPSEFVGSAASSPAPGVESARGKVALLRRGSQGAAIASLQLADTDGRAAIAACSNATAAAVARYSRISDCPEPVLAVVLPDAHDARVIARVRTRGGSTAVAQTWHGVRIDLGDDTEVDRRRVVVCRGALNNYLVVRTRAGETLGAFTVADALTLWRRYGMDQAPLLSRMAVVGSDDGTRGVKFFTCGAREHPSAPLTGLAVLAYAARAFDWLPSACTSVDTPRGAVRMPRVRVAGDGRADVRFPEVLVTFEETSAASFPDA